MSDEICSQCELGYHERCRGGDCQCHCRQGEGDKMNTFQKYNKLLTQAKAMSKNEIKALCWAFNGVRKVNLTDLERHQLRQLVDAKAERPITKEQAEFGIKWLKTKAFKLNGEARRNCVLGQIEQSIVKNFSHFKFVGLYDANSAHGYSNYHAFVPIWRTYAKDGRYFDYVVRPGMFGEFEIIGCCSEVRTLKLVRA
jgi:hypothetical protein